MATLAVHFRQRQKRWAPSFVQKFDYGPCKMHEVENKQEDTKIPLTPEVNTRMNKKSGEIINNPEVREIPGNPGGHIEQKFLDFNE